jgi:hypothetical protein
MHGVRPPPSTTVPGLRNKQHHPPTSDGGETCLATAATRRSTSTAAEETSKTTTTTTSRRPTSTSRHILLLLLLGGWPNQSQGFIAGVIVVVFTSALAIRKKSLHCHHNCHHGHSSRRDSSELCVRLWTTARTISPSSFAHSSRGLSKGRPE